MYRRRICVLKGTKVPVYSLPGHYDLISQGLDKIRNQLSLFSNSVQNLIVYILLTPAYFPVLVCHLFFPYSRCIVTFQPPS